MAQKLCSPSLQESVKVNITSLANKMMCLKFPYVYYCTLNLISFTATSNRVSALPADPIDAALPTQVLGIAITSEAVSNVSSPPYSSLTLGFSCTTIEQQRRHISPYGQVTLVPGHVPTYSNIF